MEATHSEVMENQQYVEFLVVGYEDYSKCWYFKG